jgi:hypothetical protein
MIRDVFSVELKPFSLFSNTSREDSLFGCDDNESFHLSVETVSPDEVMGIEFMGALIHSSGFSSNIGSTPISSDDTIGNGSSSVWFSISEFNFSVIILTNNGSEDFTTISEGKGERL